MSPEFSRLRSDVSGASEGFTYRQSAAKLAVNYFATTRWSVNAVVGAFGQSDGFADARSATFAADLPSSAMLMVSSAPRSTFGLGASQGFSPSGFGFGHAMDGDRLGFFAHLCGDTFRVLENQSIVGGLGASGKFLVAGRR